MFFFFFLIYIYTYIHTHTYIYIHTHIYIYTYIHIYIHTYIHTYTHVCIYIYIYMICMLVYFSQVHRFVLCIATSIATRRSIRTWTQHDSANPTEEVSDAGSPEHLPHAHTCINKLVLHKCAAAPEQAGPK